VPVSKEHTAVVRESDETRMTLHDKKPGAPSRHDVHRMFDRIAHRYDLLNHLLSANRDRAWRRQLVELLPPGDSIRVLDIATGTADQLIALHRSSRVSEGVGIDPADKMLAVGREKIARLGLNGSLSLRHGSAEELPFDSDSFDAATISFGIRNVTDVSRSLSEMHRVLRSNGRVLILEFSLPANRLVRAAYLFYFRRVMPRLGGIVSGDGEAYRYLNQTVETFPHGDDFCSLLKDAGFGNVRQQVLTLGIASVYIGDKP
jgi:demethylmenaquinone methyltransferase/2-methoxy-6-polyprenyl-1,4-benzoquinol methylase